MRLLQTAQQALPYRQKVGPIRTADQPVLTAAAAVNDEGALTVGVVALARYFASGSQTASLVDLTQAKSAQKRER